MSIMKKDEPAIIPVMVMMFSTSGATKTNGCWFLSAQSPYRVSERLEASFAL